MPMDNLRMLRLMEQGNLRCGFSVRMVDGTVRKVLDVKINDENEGAIQVNEDKPIWLQAHYIEYVEMFLFGAIDHQGRDYVIYARSMDDALRELHEDRPPVELDWDTVTIIEYEDGDEVFIDGAYISAGEFKRKYDECFYYPEVIRNGLEEYNIRLQRIADCLDPYGD